MNQRIPDGNPVETQEWLDALADVVAHVGEQRAGWLVHKLAERISLSRLGSIPGVRTPYRNTISTAEEKRMPGDLFMERKIRSLVRWNAMAMVMRCNERDSSLGGHISSFSSIATLYDVGFNYFFRGSDDAPGDLIYFQGHSAPGLYARSYLERRLDEEQLDNYRREVNGKGLSSYPHPWLMPDYWQFPTVSMGLGPIQAIYQAYVMKYQSKRGLVEHADRKVWCFIGDGECDEPETLGAISLAAREKLNNLIFVVNCNLQRLDGPVRGNGKIIQELGGIFSGAGWDVIKVVWGRHWDSLFEKDKAGLLQERMDEVVDGEYQNYKYSGGAYTREHFFGKSPELLSMVEDLSDDGIMQLNRGGHDPYKVYAAYAAAVESKDKPTVILAKTVKGYGTGSAGEAMNETHSLKKLDIESLKQFRDRFDVQISDKDLEQVPYYRPPEDSPEMVYMRARREALGGIIPTRRKKVARLATPALSTFEKQLQGSGEREISTTMAMVRILSILVKDKEIGERVVPIVPDEARTFGMEGMFKQLGIYSAEGQLYTPVDIGKIAQYKEDERGQILEEGITEAGAFSAWLAAATSYSTSAYPMVPFYIFYSMFGFQRIGDLAWAAGDSQARGFLIGATAGRTTLNGEGLQHQDGHSMLQASFIPNCRSYDPTYAYELNVIVQHGLECMYQKGENCFYYITTMNENYVQPPMPKGVEADIIKGMYLLPSSPKPSSSKKSATSSGVPIQLMGSGTILREVLSAADILEEDYGVLATVWSMPGINNLCRDGIECQRWNMLHPDKKPRKAIVTRCIESMEGPVVCATDYVRSYAEQLRAFIPRTYRVLGTEGFGRSDTREELRTFFEVNRHFIVLAALQALVTDGSLPASTMMSAIKKYGIDPEKPNPMYC